MNYAGSKSNTVKVVVKKKPCWVKTALMNFRG